MNRSGRYISGSSHQRESRWTTPAAAFLSGLKDRHDLSETKFLIGGYGYLTALARCDLSGDLEYADRNKIEKWF